MEEPTTVRRKRRRRRRNNNKTNQAIRQAADSFALATQTGTSLPQSKQISETDRFHSGALFEQFARLVKSAIEDLREPEYVNASPERDRWLSNFARKEPLLSGVVSNAVQIDRNRGWSIIGPKRQVRRFAPIFQYADGKDGWREFMARSSRSYYTTDFGSVIETARDVPSGPLGAIYSVDPTQCRVNRTETGPDGSTINWPLYYRDQLWRYDDYFRCVSEPANEEEFSDVGLCAVSRCIQLSILAFSLIRHSQERLFARAPRGFLTIAPITDEEWKKVSSDTKQRLDNAERAFDGGVIVLRNEFERIFVEYVALSQLPNSENFDIDQWIQFIMSGFALAFGFDISELWSPKASGFSRGTEAFVQQQKATGKGAQEFVYSLSDKINRELPLSLNMTFHERDDNARLISAELTQTLSEAIKSLSEIKDDAERRVFTRQELREILAGYKVIPQYMTEAVEETEATDKDVSRLASLSEMRYIQYAAEFFPDEPIVEWDFSLGKEVLLFKRGLDAVKRFF